MRNVIKLMQIPEDFSAFKFELTNSYLLQQKLMTLLQNNDVAPLVITRKHCFV